MSMAGLSTEVNLNITDLQTIVTILCKNTTCKHSMRPYGIVSCNLKHITIDEHGECKNKEPK